MVLPQRVHSTEEVSVWKRFFSGVAILLAGVVGYGFYEGWFVLATGGSGHEANVTLAVDRDKIRTDEKKLQGVGQRLEKKAAGRNDEDQQP